ncbi:Calx-beta domain-containing protein [Mucisphaera sp.]|uniref:Calx-beta domain-containing protein n=1 Tax=Mucisphaera sp. TaxID=2913024 RepID=UPI003D0E17A1
MHRSVFYNNSFHDEYDGQAGVSDEAAIAVDKQALLPGSRGDYSHISSSVAGLNGVMVDVQGLADPSGLNVSDFIFRHGNSDDTTDWLAAPEPFQILVRPGAGLDGSDRVHLVWQDNNQDAAVDPNEAVSGAWLEVRVAANATTGLAAEDVFYFGHAPGETGDSPLTFTVDASDELAARHAPTASASVNNPYDFNRDGAVDATDELIARESQTTFLNRLEAITPETVIAQPVTIDVGSWLTLTGTQFVAAGAGEGEGVLTISDATASFKDLPDGFGIPGLGSLELSLSNATGYDDNGDGQVDGFEFSGSFSLGDVSLGLGGAPLLTLEGLTLGVEGFVFRPEAESDPIQTGSMTFDTAGLSLLPGGLSGVLPGLDTASEADSIPIPNVGSIDVSTGAFELDVTVPAGVSSFLMLGGYVPFELTRIEGQYTPGDDGVIGFTLTGVPRPQLLVDRLSSLLGVSTGLTIDLEVYDAGTTGFVPVAAEIPLRFGLSYAGETLGLAETPPVRLLLGNIQVPLPAGAGTLTLQGSLTLGGFDAAGIPQAMPVELGEPLAGEQVYLELSAVSSSELGTVTGALGVGGTLTIDNGTFSVDLSGQASLEASDLSLLGVSGSGTVRVSFDWPLTVDADALAYSGAFEITAIQAERFTVVIPEIATLTVESVLYLPTPDPEGLIARAAGFTLEFEGLLDGLDVTAAVSSVNLYDEDGDGLTIESFELFGASLALGAWDVSLGGTTIVDAGAATLVLDRLSNRQGLVGGEITVVSDEVTLLPDGPLSVSVSDDNASDDLSAFLATLDMTTGALDLEARVIAAEIAGAVVLTATSSGVTPAVAFRLDRQGQPDDTLIGLGTLTGTLPALEVTGAIPTAVANGLAIRYDGGVELASLALSLPSGWERELGLTLVPVTLTDLAATFDGLADGTVDLDTFKLDATFEIDTTALEQELGALLGTPPTISVQSYDGSGVLTDLSSGGKLSGTLLVDGVDLRLADVSGLLLGLQDFNLDLPAGRSLSLDGSLLLPGLDDQGDLLALPSGLIPAGLLSLSPVPEAVLSVSAVADTSSGLLGGEIVVGATFTPASGEDLLLSFRGEAMVDGDLTFVGGAASGSVTAGFEWDLLIEHVPSGVLALSGAPQLNGLLFDQLVFEIEGLARLRIPDAAIDFSGATLPVVATADGATLELLLDGLEGVSGSVDNISLYDELGSDGVIDGFSFANLTLSSVGDLDLGPEFDGTSLFRLTDATIQVPEFTYRSGSLTSGLPDVLFMAGGTALNLPGVVVQASGLSIALRLDDRSFEATATSVSLGVGPAFDSGSAVFDLRLNNPTFTVDDDPLTDLLTLVSASLAFGPDAGPLSGLLFGIEATAENQNQAVRLNLVNADTNPELRIGLGELVLTSQGDSQGILTTLGLGGVLPLDIDSLSLSFTRLTEDGYTDLAGFDVGVEGAFDFSVFGDLRFMPAVSVGQTALAGAATAENATDLGQNRFGFDVAFDFTGVNPFPVIPIVQDLVVGLSGLEFGGFGFEGELRVAGYRLDENADLILLGYGVDASGQTVLYDLGEDADPNEEGIQPADQILASLEVSTDNPSGSGAGVDFTFNGLSAELKGSLILDGGSYDLNLTGGVQLDGTVGFGNFIVLDSLGLNGFLNLSLAEDFSGGSFEVGLLSISTEGLTIGLGTYFEATAGGAGEDPLLLNLSNDESIPLIENLSVRLASPAIGLYGTVDDLDLFAGALPDFSLLSSVTIGVEEGSMLDTLQDWFLPMQTNEISLDFLTGFFATAEADSAGDPPIIGIADPTAVKLLTDGSIGLPGFLGDALGDVGLEANVAYAGVGFDVAKLTELAETFLAWAGELGGQPFDAFISGATPEEIQAAFAAALLQAQTQGLPFGILELGEVVNLDDLNALGLSIGLELGDGFAASGAFTVGRADANEQTDSDVDDIYYLAISGALRIASYGGGGTVILTTAGPIAATVDFGVPIPLGPSTLTLGGGGTIVFGQDLLQGVETSQPTINPADIPSPADWDLTEIATIEGILGQLWNGSGLDPIWSLPATLALRGELTSLAVLGLVSVTGEFAATFPSLDQLQGGQGLSLLGTGDLRALGLPFATAGVLVDARDVLNPTFSFGLSVPPADNPLAFLFPGRAELAGTLRTDGMIEAWFIGLRTVLDGALAGTNSELAGLLDEIARGLEADRLAGRENDLITLLDLSVAAPITGSGLGTALVGVLSSLTDSAPVFIDPQAMTDPWTVAGLAVTAFWREAQQVLSTPEVFARALGDAFGAAFAGALASGDQALIDAYQAFNPAFALSGAIQPSLLGFPIGDPTNEVDLILNKNQITLDLETTNVIQKLNAIFATSGITDQLQIGFTAQLPGTLIDVLVDPSSTESQIAAAFGDALNPFTGWEARLAGTLGFQGFDLARISGIVFGPQDTDPNGQAIGGTLFAEGVYNFGYADGFDFAGSNTELPTGQDDKIPVYLQSRYDDMTAYGGLLLTGELMIPDLLRDPATVISALGSLTADVGDDLSGPWSQIAGLTGIDLSDFDALIATGASGIEVVTILADYLTGVVELLTDNAPLGTLQLYAPSPATLVDSYTSYLIPALVGPLDGSGEVILADRIPGTDGQGHPAFQPAQPVNGQFGLRFADLNGNRFYDPRIDVLIDDSQAWSDHIPQGSSVGNLAFGVEDALVSSSLLVGADVYLLADVAEDLGNGLLDPARLSGFDPGVSAGFIDTNRDGRLDWSADPATGVINFLEPLIDAATGADLVGLAALPGLVVFRDEQALVPGRSADGYTAPSPSAAGDPLLGLNEGFADTNGNGRFDLGVDVLYDLNGNGLPDGELFLDVDLNGRQTRPDPFQDVNGNGVRDVSESLTESFTDLDGNGAYDTGDPVLDLGNGLYDPPASPVFSFDDATTQTQELLAAAYLDGFVDLTLLGLDLGKARLRAGASGLVAEASSGPYGVDLTATFGFNQVNAGELIGGLVGNPLTELSGGKTLLEALLPASVENQADAFLLGLIDEASAFSFPVPVFAIDTGFDLSAVQAWLARTVGPVANDLFIFTDSAGNPEPIGATTRVELFSPLFNDSPPAHPTDVLADPRYVQPPLRQLDDIQHSGGGRLSATLNLPGFAEGVVGVFESQFPDSPDDLFQPDFAFLASADRLAIPQLGEDVIRAEDLRLSLVKDSSLGGLNSELIVSGSVGVLEGLGGGLSAGLSGQLAIDANAGLYGALLLELDTGSLSFGSAGIVTLGANADARLLVNTTGSDRTIMLSTPGGVVNVDVEANSGALWVDGVLNLGTLTLDGTFLVRDNAEGLVLYGDGNLRDNALAYLLGPDFQSGIDVTFAGGIQRATITELVDFGGFQLPLVRSDGVYGGFVFDTNTSLAIASGGTTLSVGFNSSSSSKVLDFTPTGLPSGEVIPPVFIPSSLQSLLTIDANSLRLFARGDLALDGLVYDLGLNGLFATQIALTGDGFELDLFADATADLGFFGSAAVSAWLELGGSVFNPTAAGHFAVKASRLGINNLVEIRGEAFFTFNSGRFVDVPSFVSGLVPDIEVSSGTYVELGLRNARVDLFNDSIAVGGTGAIGLSDSSGLTVSGALAIEVMLPSEVTDPFDGLVPDTISYGGSLPSATTGSLAGQSGTQSMTLDLGTNGVITLSRQTNGVLDIYGYLAYAASANLFSGLFSASGTADLRINTTASGRIVDGNFVSGNSFELDLDGSMLIDPGLGGDTNVNLAGSINFRAVGTNLDLTGSADLTATVLGNALFGGAATLDINVVNGSLLEARFTTTFELAGFAPVFGVAELTPSGCLDLPGLLPDGCATLEIVFPDSSFGEAAGVVEVDVFLTDPVPLDSRVILNLSESDPDVTLLEPVVIINAGESSAKVSVRIEEDTLIEPNDGAFITITSATLDYLFSIFDETLTGDLTSFLEVIDNDTPHLVFVEGFAAGVDPDGSGGNGTSARFEFKITNEFGVDSSVTEAVTVDYIVKTSQSTATLGSDFTAPSGRVTIPANTHNVIVSVPVLNDNLIEGNETITLEITGLSGANNVDVDLDRTGTATIIDQDTAEVSIAVIDDSATEGLVNQSGLPRPDPASFLISLSRVSSSSTTISLSNSPPILFNIYDQAIPGSDFTHSATVTIPAGSTTATVVVGIVDDRVTEEVEIGYLQIDGITSGNSKISIAQTPYAFIGTTALLTNDFGSFLINDNDTLIFPFPPPPDGDTEAEQVAWTAAESEVVAHFWSESRTADREAQVAEVLRPGFGLSPAFGLFDDDIMGPLDRWREANVRLFERFEQLLVQEVAP